MNKCMINFTQPGKKPPFFLDVGQTVCATGPLYLVDPISNNCDSVVRLQLPVIEYHSPSKIRQ